MKSIKMLDLAVLTALMAMAFAGASPVMAENTQLCSAHEATCAKRNVVTHIHEETLSGTKAKLLAGETGTVECDALFLGDTLGSGAPLLVHGDFTYTNCRLGELNCTVTEESATSLIEVLKLGYESADVTGEGEVRVRCEVINCVYNGEELLGTATGPLLSSFSNGDVTLNEQTVNKVSGTCPSTGKLDISTMPLEAVYITGTGENTQLCSAEEVKCAEGSIVSHVHEETLSGAKAKLLAGATGTVECDALYLGDSLGLGRPLVIHGNFTYTNCRLGGTNCTVTELSSSSLIEVLKLGYESADVTGEGEVRVRCEVINCVYDGNALLGTATGPLLSSFSNGDVTLNEQTVNKVSGTCPSTGKLDISTMPLEAVYITGTGENTQLCSADEATCEGAGGTIVTHVHEETLSGAKAKLLADKTGTVECDALFLGDSLGLGEGEPLVIHGNFTYTNCRLGGTNCTVTELSSSSLIEVLKLGHESADVTGEGEVRVRCGIFINCVYNGEGLAGTATGPLLSSFENGDVTLTKQSVHKVSGICPSTGELDISTMPLEAIYLSS